MKKHINIIWSLVAIVIMSSCADDFLTIKPENLELTEDAIITAENLQQYMLSSYDAVRSNGFYSGIAKVTGDVLADDALTDNREFTWTQITNRAMNLFNPNGRDVWNNTYQAIDRANFTMRKIPEIFGDDANGTEANILRGEGLFIRALGHFHIVRFFSYPYAAENLSRPGIPYRTTGIAAIEEAAEIVGRGTLQNTYTRIIEDLEDAIELLPEFSETGANRISKQAAQAILAKVYFQMNDFANASTYADMVHNTDLFMLQSDVKYRYARASEGLSPEDGKEEVIFRLVSTAAADNSAGTMVGIYRSNDESRGNPQYYPSPALVNAFDANDKRREAYFLEEGGNIWSANYNYDYVDAIVITYGELQLIRAEAHAEVGNIGDATDAINDILERAGLNTLSSPNANAIINTSRAQRRLELALEGERLHELKRLRSDNIRGASWNDRSLLFQIPDSEQNGNPGIELN